MIRRLLKIEVNEVLSDMKVDSLLVAEWTLLEQLCDILEPFAAQTNILQSGSLSLSLIIPSILDLQCHLQQYPSSKTFTDSLLREIEIRFAIFLYPFSDNFNLVPAAACILDPTVALAILGLEHSLLLDAAKDFIINEVPCSQIHYSTYNGSMVHHSSNSDCHIII